MNEALHIWNAVIATLHQRGLLTSGQAPVADGIILPDRIVFILDMEHLAGIPREAWLDRGLHLQLRAALGGRPVAVTDSFGLAVQVGRYPAQPRQPLPRHVPLDLSHCPAGMAYPIPLGVGHRGPVWCSLPDLGHILVGGTTRTGKTAWIRAALTALTSTHTADQVRIAVVDPKGVDFARWEPPHLLGMATDVDDAARLVGEVLTEAEARQSRFAAVGANSLAAYQRATRQPIPAMVLVVDEFIDLAVLAGMRSPFYRSLLRLASKGAGLGIYLVLAATNPKAEIVNTLIRANCATRLAFRCAERRQSEAILEQAGAEDLPAVPGRMLARLPGRPGLLELQAYYVEALPQTAGPALTEEERALVEYAIQHLGGAFPVGQLAEAFRGRMTAWRIRTLAEEWERRGWLTRPRHATDPRRVTDELLEAAGLTRTGT